MVKLNEKQRYRMTVKYNINLCYDIINKAERINKGMYVHQIKTVMQTLKPLLKKVDRRSPGKVSLESLIEICRHRASLSESLYFLEHNMRKG